MYSIYKRQEQNTSLKTSDCGNKIENSILYVYETYMQLGTSKILCVLYISKRFFSPSLYLMHHLEYVVPILVVQ